MDESIFKAYDIRGVYPSQIDEDTVYKIAQAYARFINPRKVALGRDVRVSGEALWKAAAAGLTDAGVSVVDIGVVSTDMMYFAVPHLNLDGGITISASHNPAEYNGMKMVRKDSVPISGDTGIQEMKEMVKKGDAISVMIKGEIVRHDIMQEYVKHCLSFVDVRNMRPLKIVANANFGMAGKALERIIAHGKLPFEISQLNFEPDGTFPKGRPDPLVSENRGETEKLVKTTGAQFAVAWDADADRCFFFDEKGNFIDGYYIVALLATILLRNTKNEKIIIDPRMVFATRKAIVDAGGTWIMNKVGHAFIKERMRKEHALFAGENSAHLYFRDNFFCDNGMIPFLLIAQELSISGKSLSELVAPWIQAVHVSGEINFTVADPKAVIKQLAENYDDGQQDWTDGLSVEYADARFNVRPSNTEPLLRLNIEAYDAQVLQRWQDTLTKAIAGFAQSA